LLLVRPTFPLLRSCQFTHHLHGIHSFICLLIHANLCMNQVKVVAWPQRTNLLTQASLVHMVWWFPRKGGLNYWFGICMNK
uniref:Uncharacterized protein n=1 Tax=Aegilops tauschii subsp. strangulata TaxID=200361 RepID=A0A453LZ36_AEGTS